ncbi:response regulator [Desulfoplanes sp. PS50]
MSQTILIVDDSASIRQMVKFTLEGAGYTSIEATDGNDALTKINPDVKMILTDLNMPGLDGFGLIKAVRQMAAFKFIPIIMLTTESQASAKAEGKAAGATGWIVKPFKPDQLLGVVKKVLR